MLALAYLIERKVGTGELASYAQAAQVLRMSKARVSQIMGLLNLPVPIQEGILVGKLDIGERGSGGWWGSRVCQIWLSHTWGMG